MAGIARASHHDVKERVHGSFIPKDGGIGGILATLRTAVQAGMRNVAMHQNATGGPLLRYLPTLLWGFNAFLMPSKTFVGVSSCHQGAEPIHALSYRILLIK